ncbi:MAG: cation:proton antiporter [Vulcanisaeta sp.]|nr:cation:proton antiporter [Vulcanisaeta sp.]
MAVEAIYTTLLEVSILILVADLVGVSLVRFGLPRVVGELLVGIALSPFAIGGLINGFFHVDLFAINDYLIFLTNLSVILLLFASGLEHGLSTLREGGFYGVLAAVFGAVAPYVLVYYTLIMIGVNDVVSSIIALSTAPTSLAVVAGIIEREGLRDLPSTKALITAASIDDVVALIMLSLILSTVNGSMGYSMWLKALGIVALWVSIFLVSVILIPRILNRVGGGLIIYAAMVVLFGLVLLMTLLGFSEVIAAFIAGVAVAESRYSARVDELINALLVIFGSIFFISIGMQLNPAYLVDPYVIVVGVVVSVVAMLGKVIGVYPFAYLRLRNSRDAIVASYGMIPRGEMGLVVASIALTSGLIDMGGYGVIVLMVLITTILGSTIYRRGAMRLRSTQQLQRP